jgi:hypothetical protein
MECSVAATIICAVLTAENPFMEFEKDNLKIDGSKQSAHLMKH